MKKLLIVLLFANIVFSQNSGNYFLENYPFGKKWEDLSTQEAIDHQVFQSYIEAFIYSNTLTAHLIQKSIGDNYKETINSLNFFTITKGKMDKNQIIRIVKKYCDNNPHRTHLPFGDLLWDAMWSTYE